MDTLVLGCTHYIFVAHELRTLVGPDVQFIETGEPVARQTKRLLDAAGLLQTGGAADGNLSEAGTDATPSVLLLTTGPVAMMEAAAKRWLNLPTEHCRSVSVR